MMVYAPYGLCECSRISLRHQAVSSPLRSSPIQIANRPSCPSGSGERNRRETAGNRPPPPISRPKIAQPMPPVISLSPLGVFFISMSHFFETSGSSSISTSNVSGTMPNTFEVEIEELPDVSKKWLIEMKNTPSGDKLMTGGMGWAIFGLLIGGGGLLPAVSRLFLSPDPLGQDGLFAIWMGLLLSGLLTAWCLKLILEHSQSPYGAYTIMHPLYL